MKWATDEFTGKRFGKYEVLCRLAVGGMAELFLAFARSGDHLGQPVVLKRILAEQREDEHALQMLLDEAKLTATLNHLNVARVLDLEVDGEEVLLVIEFISGVNMEELVASYAQKDEVVPLGLVLSVIREAAQGLAHAHSHVDAKDRPTPIVHRDVTPRNIMLSFGGVTKMLDFGIARAMGTRRRTVAGMVRGTTAYMSPEQAVGRDVNPQSDIFALGVIFHELLTGHRLFARDTPGEEMAAVYEGEIAPPSKVNRRVPKALDAVVLRALDRSCEKRYPKALELVRDISLTAGSTVWSAERCGQVVLERFANRERDIQKLLASIPRAELGMPALTLPTAEARTLIAQMSTQTGMPLLPGDDAQGAKTLMHGEPFQRTGESTRITDPEYRAVVDQKFTSMRVTLPLEIEPTEATRIVGRTAQPVAEAAEPEEETAAPPSVSVRRAASEITVPRSSRAALITVGAVAVVLGVLVGAIIANEVAAHQAPTLGRLSVAADRPAELMLGGQSIGQTPVTGVLLPVGRHQLVLKEKKGPRRVLEVVVTSSPDTQIEVVLDALPKVP